MPLPRKMVTVQIVDSANHPFCFAILLRSVWATEAKGDAMNSEEGTRSVIIKFAAVVSLHRLEWELKFGADMSVKVFKHRKNIRFSAQLESPQNMREIIKDNKIILKPRSARSIRRPYIAMNKLKRNKSC